MCVFIYFIFTKQVNRIVPFFLMYCIVYHSSVPPHTDVSQGVDRYITFKRPRPNKNVASSRRDSHSLQSVRVRRRTNLAVVEEPVSG